MVEHIATWFRQGLGARIDAIGLALEDLENGHPGAVESLQRLAFSVSAPAKGLGARAVYEAAERVRQSPRQVIPGHARTLIRLLRQEAAQATASPSTILLVGGDPEFNTHVAGLVQTAAREVVHVPTGEGARDLLAKRDVACIVLSLFLPDMDGRALFAELKDATRTASVPTFLLAAKVSDTIRQDDLLAAADDILDHPDSPEKLADLIKRRLRRAHPVTRGARRDCVTGLLNRAAFCEAFARVKEECEAAGEPLAVASVSLQSASRELETHSAEVQEKLLQTIGTVLSKSLRSTDVLGRWDNLEFAVLFPAEDQYGASRAISKIIASLVKQSLRASDGTEFRPALAAGVSVVAAGMELDDAMAEADRFCFQAVSAGGNQVLTDQSLPARDRTSRVLLLLREDNTTTILKQLFKKDGFAVTHIPTADGAIPTGEGRQRFHLIVIDENIPSKGGFEALREVRSHPSNNRIPIVILISDNTEENIVRALEMGANDYIIRPFSPFTFIQRMRRLLTRGVAIETHGSHTTNVLLVDDSTSDLVLAGTALHQRGGFRVHLAKGGEEGLARFADLRPDVLVVAVSMRGMDGLELLGKLPQDVDLSETTVILATAPDESREFKELLSAGVRGPIGKPYDPLTFGKRIEAFVGVEGNASPSKELTEHLNSEIRRVALLAIPSAANGS